MLLIILFLNFVYSKHSVSAYFAIFDEAYNSTMNVSNQIPWKMFDRIMISFAILDKEGNLTNPLTTDHNKILHIMSLYKKAKPNGEIFITLFGDNTDEYYIYAANHSKKFSESVLKYLKKYNFNGIDLDWETISINRYSDTLVTLIKSCKEIFKNKYKITHAIWPYVHDPKTVGLLADMVDEINIMSYGFSAVTTEYLIKQYNASGFPYEKMVLGIETEIGIDTKDIIFDKINLINKYNLSGIFEWRLDNDDITNGKPSFKTTKILYNMLNNYKFIL